MAKRYFKLGKQAASFTDVASGLVISGKQTVSIDSKLIKKAAKRIKDSLTQGHIVELSVDQLQGAEVISLPLKPFDKTKREKLDAPFVKNMRALMGSKEEETEEEETEEELNSTGDTEETEKEVGEKTGFSRGKLSKRILKSDKLEDSEKKNLHKLSMEELEDLYEKSRTTE